VVPKTVNGSQAIDDQSRSNRNCGTWVKALAKFGCWSIEIVKRMADTVGFEVLPRRWVVERTLA
jgi:transposase